MIWSTESPCSKPSVTHSLKRRHTRLRKPTSRRHTEVITLPTPLTHEILSSHCFGTSLTAIQATARLHSCQIFLNITAYVHQFVDTGLDRYIALEFAKYHSQPSALKQARAPGKDMQPVKFSNGLHTTYLSYLEATDRDGLKPTHSMPCLEKLYISSSNIQSLADIDSRRLKMACLCSYDQVNTTKLIRYCTRLRGGISSEVRHTESSDSMKMQVMDVLKRQICGGWSVGSELDSSDDGRSFTTAQESYAFDDTF